MSTKHKTKNKSTKTQQNNARGKRRNILEAIQLCHFRYRLIHTLYRLSSSLAFTAMDIHLLWLVQLFSRRTTFWFVTRRTNASQQKGLTDALNNLFYLIQHFLAPTSGLSGRVTGVPFHFVHCKEIMDALQYLLFI